MICAAYRGKWQRATTLSELLVLIIGISAALQFFVYCHWRHHWALGVLALPLGFCSALAITCLGFEFALRRGYKTVMARTPSEIIRSSLSVGAVGGVIAGLVLYRLISQDVIPTRQHNGEIETRTPIAHVSLLSSSLFGASTALTIAFFLMLRRSDRKSDDFKSR